MVIATSAHGMYSSGGDNVAQVKLWRHSLSTATAARQIAKQIKHPEKEEVFVAALLHDVGKLVLLQKLPEWYLRIIGEVEKHGCSFSSIESRVFRFDHCDVASVLLSKWSFPASLVRAISYHHQPPALRSADVVPVAQIINLANYMAKNLDVGFDDEKVENLTDLESAQSMALDEETLNQISEEFQGHYREEIRTFEES
jgi:putative nucleotidyltransferase with HDIG domain